MACPNWRAKRPRRACKRVRNSKETEGVLMKRMILAGILSIVAGIPGLVAQQPPAKKDAAAQKGPQPKSQGELTVVQALFTAMQGHDADGTIKASEELQSKYKDSDFTEIALISEATAYQQKNDSVKAQIYSERVLG